MSAQRTRRFLGNYLSTLAFIGLSWWIVSDLSGFHKAILQGRSQIDVFGIDAVLTVRTLFLSLIALYAVVLIPFYLRYPWVHSKAFVFLQGLCLSARRLRRPWSHARAARLDLGGWRLPLKAGLSPTAKQAGLTLLLKFYFAPLMINWCLDHAGAMANSLEQFWRSLRDGASGLQLFDGSLFWACFQAILFIDTLLFTLGYLVESPALRNRIRSVDPTFFGWFICLACYPPFNDFTGHFLAWQSADFPQFSNLPGTISQASKNALHVVANVTLLASLAVYSCASIALGLKASNLTNRGIVSRGPYSLVRHPAYAAKNLAWWIGALPNLYVVAIGGDWRQLAYAVFALCGWTAIYALRALTEERHLLLGDNGYADYMRRVKYRFIPGVI